MLMNPITSLKQVLDDADFLPDYLVRGWKKSPVYIDEDVELHEENRKLDEHLWRVCFETDKHTGDKKLRMPFDFLRVYGPKGKSFPVWNYIHTDQGQLNLLHHAVTNHVRLCFFSSSKIVLNNVGGKDVFMETRSVAKIYIRGQLFGMFDSTGELSKNKLPKEFFRVFDRHEEFRRMISYAETLSCVFLSSSHHPALVSPDPRGRSVEWLAPRSHIVLIHRSCGINNAKFATGSKTETTAKYSQSIKKISHARRAHFRILRSPRFIRKIGAKIFVKSTWVGPKEWEDATGQVYKII
jgi:hypothetical protein